MSKAQVLAAIRRKVVAFNSQKAVAMAAGVSEQFLCDVLNGRREPTGALLDFMGLEEVVSYRKLRRPRR